MSFSNQANAPTAKVTSAQEISIMLEELSAQSAKVVDKTSTKLSCVMRTEPQTESNGIGAISGMPPYFDDLRKKIESVKMNLNSIEEYLRLTDI